MALAQNRHGPYFGAMGAKGFTLFELMVTITLVAILAGTAVPAFGDLIRDSRRSTHINQFVHSIHLAKREAIMRGQYVALCKIDAQQRCAGKGIDWDEGWMVFVNSDRDQPVKRDAGEPVLYLNAADPAIQIVGNRNAFTFRPFTRRSTNGTLVFCDSRGSQAARAVIISYTGRPRVSQRDSRGRVLPC